MLRTLYAILTYTVFVASFRPIAHAQPTKNKTSTTIRYPSNAYALSKSLIKMAKNENLIRLEAYSELTQKTLVVDKVFAKKIKSVNIKAIGASNLNFLDSFSNTYEGKYIDQESLSLLKKSILSTAQKHGYYKAKLNLKTTDLSDDAAVINVIVDTGPPCLIEKIDLNFKLPPKIQFLINEGQICDSGRLRLAINRLESELIEQGYNQFKVDEPQFIYNEESNRAIAIINGRLGKKVTYSVNITDKSGSLSFDLLEDSDLNFVDPSITSPNYIRLELLRNYQNQGYSEAFISTARIQSNTNDAISYQFDIRAGPKYLINEVEFDGLQSLSESEALDVMELIGSLGRRVPFTEEVVRSSTDRLRDAIAARGYWDVKIDFPRIVKNQQEGSVKLVLTINEGRQRILDLVKIEGNVQFFADEIRSWLPINRNETFSWKDLIELQNKIRDRYRSKGFLYTETGIDILLRPELNKIRCTLLIKIKEGDKAVIGSIYLSGNVKSKDRIIQNLILFKTGDTFDSEAIEATRKELMQLGLFSFVSVRPANPIDITNKKSVIDYEILVKESKPGTIAFGPSWSLYEGSSFSAETAYNNISGMARQIFIKGGVKEEKDQAAFGNKTLLGRDLGAGFIEPFLFDTPISGRVSINHLAEADSAIWEISRSLETSLSYRFRYPLPTSKFEIQTLWRSTRIETEEDESRLILISKDDVQIRQIGARFSIDTRNSISWPTKGYIFQTDIARAFLSFGGDTSYTRFTAEVGWYYMLKKDFVFAVGASGGSYKSIVRKDPNPDVLPASEVFKSGGATTNRGFRDNELGPVLVYTDKEGNEKRFNTGGSQTFSAKFELRYQLIDNTLALTAFTDVGNSFFSSKEKAIIDSTLPQVNASLVDNEPYRIDDLPTNPRLLWERNYVSYGLALNYLSPLGSINLSYGFPLKRCITEANCIPRGNDSYRQLTGGQIHVSVGATF